jgi:hypothetical protein
MTKRYNEHRFIVVVALAHLLLAIPVARAQTLYLDTNGDGVSGRLDVLNGGHAPEDCLTEQTTSVDVYFVTDKNPDGTTATCPTSGEAMTISSYQVVLRQSGSGAVYPTGWTDNMGFETPAITVGDGTFATAGTETWVGRSGNPLPAGKYKLGTLAVTVTGYPALDFVTSSTISPAGEAFTGFGSACGGAYVAGALAYGGDFPTSNGFGIVTCSPTPVLPTTWGKIKQQYR